MHHISLTDAARTLGDNVALVRHLASIVETIRYELPEGYGARADADGIARPVEQVLLANETRGVTRHVDEALYALNIAAGETAKAARALDSAITAWEHPRAHTNATPSE